MKEFQTPGSREKAEWLYLFTTKDKQMGWYKHITGTRWIVIMLRDTRGWAQVKEPLYSYALVLDLDRITLPEKKDLFPDKYNKIQDRLLLRALVKHGRGHAIASSKGLTPYRVRLAVKDQVDDLTIRELSMPGAPSAQLHHRKWESLLEEHPADYQSGFFSGLARSNGEDRTEAFDAGWRHGWECAVGRSVLPEWYEQETRDGTEG